MNELILECIEHCHQLKQNDIKDEWIHISDDDFELMKIIIETVLID